MQEQVSNAVAGPGADAGAEIVLHLYVAGTSARSLQAVERVSRLCARYLEGRYQLEVIDIYQHPAQAEAGQIVAVPTLVRSLPSPLKHIVGDMSDEHRVLLAMGVPAAA